MNDKRIEIRKELNSPLADDPQKGDIIFNSIKRESEEYDKIILDFKDIELVNTAFLNNAIGRLFNQKEYDINQHPIIISNMNASMRELLTESVKVARAKYI